MLIRSRPSHYLSEHQVTDEAVFHGRRRLLERMGFIGLGAMLSQPAAAGLFDGLRRRSGAGSEGAFATRPLQFAAAPDQGAQALTSEAKVTGHNNFYEFGLGKEDPLDNAQGLSVDPWTLAVDGEVGNGLALHYEDLFRFDLEERIYRLRCVEAWSMVIPWVGFPLSTLLKRAEPKSGARYVAFQTLHDPEQMPGQRNAPTLRLRLAAPQGGPVSLEAARRETDRWLGGIPFPYVEGLRLDEAMHPLTLLAVGVYGKTLPPQNGAPIRLVVPWKYGFKSIKSIVRISLVQEQPPTTWNLSAPHEYGFYANVNPGVDHPRWSQASERRILTGGLGSDRRIPTELFNGYAESVAALYKNMDLSRHF